MASVRNSNRQSLIVFELNEVPAKVLEDYIAAHPQSAFAELVSNGNFATTVSEDIGHLSPWITWPTVHRGVNNAKHEISFFGQPLGEVDAKYPPVWKLLASSEISVGLFGSLHSYPPPEDANFRFYVPDTFAPAATCIPKSIEPFQQFNLQMVAASARNVSRSLPATALTILPNLLRLGVTPSSLGSAAVQLASELTSPWKSSRRRSYQAILGFDIFIEQLRRHQPRFATFFTNHVASAMHRYWAAVYPDDFERNEFDEQWRKRYQGEIDWAMDRADNFLRVLMRHCTQTDGATLLVVSSMGQGAHDARRVATQIVLSRPEQFLAALGLRPTQWERRPAMVPQFNFVVDDAVVAPIEARLATLQIGGKPIEFSRDQNFFSVSFGQLNLPVGNEACQLDGAAMALDAVGLENLRIEDEAGSTAYHIPDGILLWFGQSRTSGRRHETPIPTTALAPWMCDYFDVPRRDYMRAPPPLF